MAKRKRETEWEVIRLKATPAAFVGLVQAPDKASALKTAITQFNIRRKDQTRLLIRPRMTPPQPLTETTGKAANAVAE